MCYILVMSWQTDDCFSSSSSFSQHHLSNRPTPGLPGLEDLGITPQSVETKALATLRRFRDFLDYNKPIEDIQPTTSSTQPK